jgi:segregation and condensation protein B
VSSGFRFQARSDVSRWISRLWEERAPRYSRALLETLALVAYRQPITRAEIEDIRGVVVSSSIMKTLQERGWVRIVGHRDVPGKPAMYASTREFLDYFNLKSLDDLPTLAELRDIDKINAELDLRLPGESRQEQLAANDISADPLALAALITADFEPVEYV